MNMFHVTLFVFDCCEPIMHCLAVSRVCVCRVGGNMFWKTMFFFQLRATVGVRENIFDQILSYSIDHFTEMALDTWIAYKFKLICNQILAEPTQFWAIAFLFILYKFGP